MNIKTLNSLKENEENFS